MGFDVRQVVAGALTIGMFLALLDMMIGGLGPSSRQEITVSVVTSANEVVGQFDDRGSVTISVTEKTPERLWGVAGPILQPCWSKQIPGKPQKIRGFVLLKLSNNPLYHPMQVADAVIVAHSLGAILVLPSGFKKLYDEEKFIANVNGIVRVVAKLPTKLQSFIPEIVKVPYKVSSDYIEEKLRPIFGEKHVIQVRSLFPTTTPVKDSATVEIKAIRCMVMYGALQFHPKVKELGEKAVSTLRELSGSNQFIAVDLHVEMLNQMVCRQSGDSKSKRCFDASDIAAFLKRVGFTSGVPIYLTQSTWDKSLDVLKDNFPRIYTKDQISGLTGGQQSQLEKALDVYICTQSDVFVPAISGFSYVHIAGQRILAGRTQILVPMVNGEGSSSTRLEVARVMSRFVTKKDHNVYSCFCKSSSSSMKPEEDIIMD